MHWWWHGNRYGPKEFNPDLSAGIGQAVQLDEVVFESLTARGGGGFFKKYVRRSSTPN